MKMQPLRLVTATRLPFTRFWRESLLGQSLRLFPTKLLPELCITFDNTGDAALGLPAIYNAALEDGAGDYDYLFVHDDVFIHDVFLRHRVAEGLKRYDVVGLAGSRGSDPKQPSWGLAFDSELNPTGWQRPQHVVLSGAVSHLPVGRFKPELETPSPLVSLYGNYPAACDLLDGLFLAVRGPVARRLRFDPRFSFHLYDLDFCRSARLSGYELGTWPVLVTHGSGGAFGTPAFKTAARMYLDKWGDAPLSSSGPHKVTHTPTGPVIRAVPHHGAPAIDEAATEAASAAGLDTLILEASP